jgi:hypothetical protein
MRERSGYLLVGLLALSAGAAGAQERDAQVTPTGQLRLTAGAEYRHVVEGFRGMAGGAPDRLRLTAARLPALGPVAAGLVAFFAATGGPPAVPDDAAEPTAGDLALEVAWTTRTLPLRAGLGVFPRVELGVGVGIVHQERLARRTQLSPGNLGLNPQGAANAELLGRLDTGFAQLGAAPALPLADSPLGEELQRRVVAATGDSLALPTAALGVQQLADGFDLALPGRRTRFWLAEHVDLDAKVEILRSFPDGLHPPPDEGFAYRAAVGAGVRIPIDLGGGAQFAGGWGPGAVLPGARVEGLGDLFFTDRVWLSGGASLTSYAARQVQLVIGPGGELRPDGEPTEVRRSPGNELELWVVPRMRLTREISVGGALRSLHRAAGTDEIGGVSFPLPAATHQLVGFSFRYTTLPAVQAGRTARAVEATVGYTAPLRGDGAAGGSLAFLQVSLFHPVWGRNHGNE